MELTSMLGLVIPVGLLIFFLIMMSNARVAVEQDIARAQAAYNNSLDALKADPTNPDLRQQTLTLGRQYSDRTRSRKGVTVYDEMAVMNDINAATARAFVAAPVTSPPSVSIEDRLKKLDDLKAAGVITEQEFSARRQKILEEL